MQKLKSILGLVAGAALVVGLTGCNSGNYGGGGHQPASDGSSSKLDAPRESVAAKPAPVDKEATPQQVQPGGSATKTNPSAATSPAPPDGSSFK